MIVQANRTARSASTSLSQALVNRSVAGSAYAARAIGPMRTSRRSMAPNAPTSIWRKVRITAASRPADSQAPVFQLPGPWFTCESKPRVLEDLEDAARRRPGIGSADGVAGDRDLDHREVGGGDELREDRDEEDPEDRERRADDEPRRHGADGVRRLAAGPADHDEVAQDQTAEGDERDRQDEHPAVQVGHGRVGHRVERRQEVALEVPDVRVAGVVDHVRVPDREVVDRVADERDVALAIRAGQRRGRRRWRLGGGRRTDQMAGEPERRGRTRPRQAEWPRHAARDAA